MDIQPVSNEQNTVAYMCAYLTKSNAMKQALKVSIENNCGNHEQVKAIAHAYSSSRERSV